MFVEFNAWLYQGYDDARAALLDVIASKLEEEAKKRETGIDKAKDLLERVKWLRGLVLARCAPRDHIIHDRPKMAIGDAVSDKPKGADQ